MTIPSLSTQVGTEAVPTREQFRELARHANLIPVYKEILADLETPVSALLKLGETDTTFLLESVTGGEVLGRYSFLGNSAHSTFASKNGSVTITGRDSRRCLPAADPLVALQEFMAAWQPAVVPGLPRFFGGAVGYISYDAIRYFEHLPARSPDDLELPDCYFIITDKLLIFDHARRRIQVVVNALVEGDPDACYDAALVVLDDCLARLGQGAPTPAALNLLPDSTTGAAAFTSTFDREAFCQAVVRCKEYIAAGDAFQIVLSQRLQTPLTASPLAVYRLLRTLNPSPYMYYLKLPGLAVAGSSPEVLVRLENGVATLRPIAGTRPRGATEEDDVRLATELLADDKERAEHVMLIDLGRNDLGRVCECGSVQVDQFMVVERYSHVMHIVSNITGRLSAGKSAFDLLRAAFPAGTVSGAPKIRAMEIIDELEPVQRGLYAGAIGYFSFSGNMDCCITIRTVVSKDDMAYVQAGAGIVADSDPQREYEESMNKARVMLNAVHLAEVAAR